MENYKLRSLYYSITNISAEKHCPMIYVGLWSLIECVTSIDGRVANTDFLAYLSTNRLESLGLGSSKDTKAIRDAITNIQKYGNATKHHGEAAGFNHRQLINDYQVIEKTILKIAENNKKKI